MTSQRRVCSKSKIRSLDWVRSGCSVDLYDRGYSEARTRLIRSWYEGKLEGRKPVQPTAVQSSARLQVGTAVVTRHPDNRLALGRLGALVEQLHTLLRKNLQVILVTSGAVCVGRQVRRRLTYAGSSAGPGPHVDPESHPCNPGSQAPLRQAVIPL